MRSSSRSTAPSPGSGAGEAASDRSAAFFDLDRTLMAGSSGLHFARAAYRARMIGRRQMAGWALGHLRFRLRGATEEASAQVLDEVKEVLREVPERAIARMTPEAMAGILPRIYPQMLAEVHSHQDAGRPTFIVSAAGHELVGLLARVLDMEGGIGTSYAVGEDGRFTGELEGPFMYADGKVAAIRRFAEDHDLDLAESWAYSDSASDLPMLRAVGRPVAVNPDGELARVAADEGWPVMRFERLGRRLAIGATTLTAAAIGGMGTTLAARRGGGRRRPRRRSARRGRR